jgi:hypothetical protein
MYLQRIVRGDDVTSFDTLLQEHQRALTSTGRTVLQNAVVAHNVMAGT